MTDNSDEYDEHRPNSAKSSGVNIGAGTAMVRNSIIAGGRDGRPDVSGAFTSGGHNLIGNVGGTGFDAEGDQVGGGTEAVLDPELLPLADNGGPTPTHALSPDSPAIDAGSSVGVEATDQRGAPRLSGTSVDIGAYEYADDDNDGVTDFTDNCLTVANQQQIAFVSSRDGNPEIYTMNADGTGVKRLTNDPVLEATPSFSKDGTRIAYSSSPGGDAGSSEIYVMDVDGGNQKRLTDNSVDDLNPAFSPDGSKIVFDSNLAGNRDLFVMNAEDGSQQTALTNHPGPEYDPTFNAAGTRIAYVSKATYYETFFVIRVMDAPGGNSLAGKNFQISDGDTKLDGNGRDAEPAFDSSGNHVAFSGSRDGTSIYSRDVPLSLIDRTASDKRLTSGSFEDRHPAYSPDGAWIAFARTTEGDSRIYAMDTNGARQVSLSSGPGDSQPSWGPQPDRDRDGLGDACDPGPAANDDAFSVDEDATLNVPARDGVLANDVDVNGFEVALVSGPDHAASFTLDKDGSFSYQSTSNFSGTDTFTYKASNGQGDSDTATVKITVKAVNDAPRATNDTATTDEDTAVEIPASDLLANDTAGPGDESTQKLTIKAVSNGQHGQPVLGDNGNVTFTPARDFNGEASFDYKVWALPNFR